MDSQIFRQGRAAQRHLQAWFVLTLGLCWTLSEGGVQPAHAQSGTAVSAPVLIQACQFPKEQAEDPAAVRGCAIQCFTAMKMIGHKAHDFVQIMQVILWVSALIVLLFVALALVLVVRIGGRAGWSAGRRWLVQLLVVLGVFFVTWGMYEGLFHGLARSKGESVFWDLWTMKSANVTGGSYQANNSMTCADAALSRRVALDGAGQAALLAPFAVYPGVLVDFPVLPTDRNPQPFDIKVRFDDMTKILAQAEEIDTAKITPNSPVPRDHGPYPMLRGTVPFPMYYPVAGALGAVLGILLALVILKLRRA